MTGKCTWVDGGPDPFDGGGPYEECDEPATHVGCNGHTCAEHRCRCAKPISEVRAEKKRDARRAEMHAVLEALGRAWERSPEQRLCQLVYNFVRDQRPDAVPCPELFYLKDTDLLAALEAWKR